MFDEYHLGELRKILGDYEEVNVWINYLSCCKKMHSLCVRSEFPEDYETVIEEYKEAFEEVHQLFGVSETLKVHILSGCTDFISILIDVFLFFSFNPSFFGMICFLFSILILCRACHPVLCLHR